MSSYCDSRDIDKSLLSFNTAFMIALIGSAGAVRLDVFGHDARLLSPQTIYLATLIPALFFAISTYQILMRWVIGNTALPLLNPAPMAAAAFLQIPPAIVYLLLPAKEVYRWVYVLLLFYALIVFIGFLAGRTIRRRLSVAQRHNDVIGQVLPYLKTISEKPDIDHLERWRAARSHLGSLTPDVADVVGVQTIDGLATDRLYGKDMQYTRRVNLVIMEKVMLILAARLSEDREALGIKSRDE